MSRITSYNVCYTKLLRIQALTFEVEVGYTAIQARDVFAIFSAPNGTWLGNGKVSVSAGTGVATVKVTVANLPAVRNNFV